MIKKLEKRIIGESVPGTVSLMVTPTAKQQVDKINELVDVVNAIQKEREAERFEIQEWIGILEAVRKSVNIHEKQIDELQMKLEPEKCETRAENVQPDTESRPENVHAVCPAVKYMGKVCRFWNGGNGKKFKNIGVLIEILSADNKRRYTCASKPKVAIMSNMKCPFCQQEMSKTENNMFYCETNNCSLRYIEMPKKAVEDFAESHQDRLNDCKRIGNLNEELIRTRKQLVTKCNQLEIAVDALKKIDWCATDYGVAQDALDKITALEQKDK